MELILSARYGEGILEFSELYEREFARVYRAAWLFGRDEDGALEATQEAFAKAWARWHRLRDKEWVVGWLIRTSHNEMRRRARRDTAVDERHDGRRDVTLAPVLDLRRALRRLPPRRRQALVLFYIGDLPISAVAEVMDTSEGTVKAHLAQGRAALKALLEESDE